MQTVLLSKNTTSEVKKFEYHVESFKDLQILRYEVKILKALRFQKNN